MKPWIRKQLGRLVFAAAIVASVATSYAPAWELSEQSDALPVQLEAGETLRFDLVLHGNQAAWAMGAKDSYTRGGDAQLVALLTPDADAEVVVELGAELDAEPTLTSATLPAAQQSTVTFGGQWTPEGSCTFAEEQSGQGCEMTIRVTLTNVGPDAASGTLQAFVQLNGPDVPEDETGTGKLEVYLVAAAP